MKVIVPIDVEPYISAQSEFIESYNWPENTEIVVVHVLHSLMVERTMLSSQVYIEQIMKDAKKLAEKMTTEFVVALKSKCPNLKVWQELREGDAIKEILKCAKEREAGMIVMGSHGRQGVGRVVLGSVAYSVLAKAPCRTIILGVPERKDFGGNTAFDSKVEITLN